MDGYAPLTVPRAASTFRRVVITSMAVVVLSTAFAEMDGALARIEVAEQPSYGLSAVGSPFDVGDSRREARCAWRAWSVEDSGPVGADDDCGSPIHATDLAAAQDTVGRGLVRVAVLVDLVLLALVLALVLQVRGWARYRSRILATSPLRGGLLRLTGVLPTIVAVAVAVTAGAFEDDARWSLATARSGTEVDQAGAVLALAPTIEVGALVVLVVPIVLLWAEPLFARAVGAVGAGDEGRRAWTDGLRQALRLLRVPLVLVAAFAATLLVSFGDQAQDAVLRWADGGAGMVSFLVSAVAVLVFTAMVWCAGHMALDAEDRLATEGRRPPLPPWVLLPGLLFAPLLLIEQARNLAGLSIVVALLVLLQWAVGVPPWLRAEPDWLRAVTSPRGAQPGATAVDDAQRRLVLRLSRLAATCVPILLAFSVVRVAVVPLAVGVASAEPLSPALVTLFVGGLVVLAASTGLPRLLARSDHAVQAASTTAVVHAYRFLGIVALSWGVGAAVVPRPVAVTTGPVGVVALALASALFLAGGAARWAESRTPVAGLRVLGFSRTPVFLLLACWLLAATLLDTGTRHDVRRIAASPDTVARQYLAGRFQAWLQVNCAAPGQPSGPPVPLVVVAAAGGGLRAAYWTAGVLDRLTTADAPVPSCPTATAANRVFAISGASGGGLGAMSFAAEFDATDPQALRGPHPGWYRVPLSQDHLSPIIARGLFGDVPRALVGVGPPDRAVALEQSLEAAQLALARPFLGGDRAAGGAAPLVLVDGTSAESGCRAMTAPIALPGAEDGSSALDPFACRSLRSTSRLPGLNQLRDYLCPDEDVRRSTAVLLGARFPWVSPAGRVLDCPGGAAAGATYVVDGGYAERTGAQLAAELATQLSSLVDAHNRAVDTVGGRRVEPWYVSIDNGYVTRAAAQRPREPVPILTPVNTALAVREAQTWAAQQKLRRIAGNRFVRVTPARAPGVQAPLGWVMSGEARRGLDRQLNRLPETTEGWSRLAQAVSS